MDLALPSLSHILRKVPNSVPERRYSPTSSSDGATPPLVLPKPPKLTPIVKSRENKPFHHAHRRSVLQRPSVIFHTSDPDVTDSDTELIRKRAMRIQGRIKSSSDRLSPDFRRMSPDIRRSHSMMDSSADTVSSCDDYNSQAKRPRRHSDSLNSYSDSVIVDNGPPPLEYNPSGTTTSDENNNNLSDPYLPMMLDKTKQNLDETFTTLLRLYNYADAGVLKNRLFVMLLSITSEQMRIAGESMKKLRANSDPSSSTGSTETTSQTTLQSGESFNSDLASLPPIEFVAQRMASATETVNRAAAEADPEAPTNNDSDASQTYERVHFDKEATSDLFVPSQSGIRKPTNHMLPEVDAQYSKQNAIRDKERYHVRMLGANEVAQVTKLRCEYCFKKYSSRDAFQRHLLTHKGERTHKCTHCSRSFYDPISFNRHLKSHNGEKAHKCEHCNMAFSKRSALEVHMRTHTGERPFVCKYCHKGFSISGNLHRHVLIHTGRRPYKCGKCPRAFNNPSHLARHISSLHA